MCFSVIADLVLTNYRSCENTDVYEIMRIVRTVLKWTS